ncbi:MAG: GNAT family N-acetyltransferase, partial [Pseudomonadales bacterium]
QQGQGLGRLALDAALKKASQRLATVMFLEVRDSNQSARALYDSVGFNEIGVRRGYYPAASGREDAVVMAKHLKI